MPNFLLSEKSSYLKEHSMDPVEWYSWSNEAFSKAEKENKLIFLSIGYSACHWCHVMHEESFKDDEISTMMNNAFVSIKVDREERPDIDMMYLKISQSMTGISGWPLNIIMTPDRKPFFASTYIPKESTNGVLGMRDLILKVNEIWKNDHDRVERMGSEIMSHIKEEHIKTETRKIDEHILDDSYKRLFKVYDNTNGGFGISPKFPMPLYLRFLSYYARFKNEKEAEGMVEKTLYYMRDGGIYDHIGYGIHRYSTDRMWFMPHFEKMLYDQALVSQAYFDAYLLSNKEEYAKTAKEILEFMIRDMCDEGGAFYTSIDADSEGSEGLFYLWKINQIKKVLDTEEMKIFSTVFGIEDEGNFGNELNILYKRYNIDYAVKKLGKPAGEIEMKIDNARRKLYEARERRIHPMVDDKILADGNGLVISSLARAGRIFGSETYLEKGMKAADFVLKMMVKDNELFHAFEHGETKIEGFLDDYAFMIEGLIELYQGGFDEKYLEWAITLAERMLEFFWDNNAGAFYFSREKNDGVIREKDIMDSVLPSGNSAAISSLLKLYQITGREEFRERASKAVEFLSGSIVENPLAHIYLLSNIGSLLGYSKELVIASNNKSEVGSALRRINTVFAPGLLVLLKSKELSTLAPTLANMEMIDGKTTFYLCSNRSCNEPTTEINDIIEKLKSNIKD